MNNDYTDEVQEKDPNMESGKLTDWAKEPTISDLKQDVDDANQYKDYHVDKIDTWLDNLYVRGSAKKDFGKNRSSITPKLIRKLAEWRYPALSEPFLDTEDMFDVDPLTYEDKGAAKQNSLVLNNQFNTKINKNKFIDEYVRTVANEGTVIVYVGWEFEEKLVKEPIFDFKPSQDMRDVQSINIIRSKLEQDPNYLNTLNPEQQQAFQMSVERNIAIIPVQIGEQEVLKTVKNQPLLEIVNYKNITIDPSANGDIDKAYFIERTFESSLSGLKKAGKYKNLDQINVNNSDIISQPDHVIDNIDEISNFNFSDKNRKKLVVHEYWGYWDINGDGILVPIVATYVGQTMIRMEKNPFPDEKLPFVAVSYLPVKNSVYGEPDGELLIDNQELIGATTRGVVDMMGKSANGQTGRKKSALDITNKRRYERGEDYEFNDNVNANEAFFTHKFPEIPQSANFMLTMQSAEAESLTGVRAFSQSTAGNIGAETAAGVRSATDAASKREMGILRRLATGMKNIGRKIISMNAVFLDEEEVIRVTNEEFVTIRRDDLQGNFDLRLNISTAEANEAKASELAFMLQTTGQTMGPQFSQLILADIARLRKMPELAKKIANYTAPTDPLEEEIKRLQVELLKAQIANENAKANENNANAELDIAKAANLNSDTDQKNLDYIEQERGVKQERDIQLQGIQARGNMALEDKKYINNLKIKLMELNSKDKNSKN